MKLAVSGKGGVGKTTLAAILARLLAEEGRQVIAIDADPAANLAAALGVPDPASIVPIRKMRDLIAERTESGPEAYGKFFKLNPHVADLPDRFSILKDGVRLMVLGAIVEGGGGCACPEGALLKALLGHLIVQRGETVIVDLEAGVEHLGRGTCQSVDAMLVVVEPTQRSVHVARAIDELAAQIGVRRRLAVGNKVRDEEQRRFLEQALDGIAFLGAMRYDDAVAQADLRGLPVFESAPSVVADVRRIREALGSSVRSSRRG
jgi:CO dehydrogenase maturation factor